VSKDNKHFGASDEDRCFVAIFDKDKYSTTSDED